MKFEFVNPYNFVPISKTAPERNDIARGETLTGAIEYSILTKTPLIIPNTSNDHIFVSDVADHKSYDFFSYNDLSRKTHLSKDEVFEPVIPGSEIRGLIRSNYEILTNSCLSSLDSDEIMNKRIAGPFKPALIKKVSAGGKENYELYDAKDYLFRSKRENCLEDDEGNNKNVKSYKQKDLKEGQKVNFVAVETNSGDKRVKPFATQLFTGKTIGYVIKGHDGPTKRNCHVFVPQNKCVSNNVKLTILEQVLAAYKKSSESYEEYSNQYKDFKANAENGAYFPVYYSELKETGVVFLAPASITKEAYQRTLADLVGEHSTCDNIKHLCPACRLFGTVIEKKKSESLASKIRFTDLKFVASSVDEGYKNVFLNPITLAPLSSPKLNNMEFYLQRPAANAVFWTYDYYVDSNGKVQKNTSGVNGRKFYWHNMHPDLSSKEKTNLNITVRPVKENIQFKGKLYFDGITKEELNTLIYILNAGDASDLRQKNHGYKFGGAKPLGFGSIAIDVEKVVVRSIVNTDHEIKYLEEEYQSNGASIDHAIQNDFEKMTRFDAVAGKTVKYPQCNDKPEIYEWFVWNHNARRMKTSRTAEVYFEYMVPMKAELQATGAVDGANDTKKRSFQQNTQTTAPRQQGGKTIGAVFKGIVNGHNKTGKFATIKLENGTKASAFDGGELKEGTAVSVRFEGIESGNGFEKWSIVK